MRLNLQKKAALKLKCPHPFQSPTGDIDICLFVMVISNDGYFATHLMTKIEDDRLVFQIIPFLVTVLMFAFR